MMVWFSWLSLILFFLHYPLYSSSFPTSSPPLCHPHESSALLHFKNSFSITNDTSYCPDYGIANPNSTASWGKGRDYCTWSGVTCDEVSGHVIRLDLPCGGLRGVIHSNNSLFLLTHLQSLVLSYNYLYGQVPQEFSYMSSLVTLDLSENYDLRLDTFTVKRMVANFTSLRELSLRYVNMFYVSPHSFTNLSTSLTSLDLLYSGLKGEIPENIFYLPKLQNLDLSFNENLTGSFPQYNWSSPLKNLSLSGTRFLIDLPYLTKTLKSLNTLFLSSCSFKGSYPALLGNLTRITSLDLSSNNFSGQIPWSSLNLERLTLLDLGGNNFIGQLPEVCKSTKSITFLCDSSKHQLIGPLPLNLKSLSLSYNVLNGTIPSWLYSLPYLQDLALSGNQFTGDVQEFKSTSLAFLSLGSNILQGLIPRSIFQQVNLLFLDLSSNNFSGVGLSEPFSKLKSLRQIDLSYNSLSRDSINSITRALPITLGSLQLSSCGISELPYSLRSLENLRYLDLSNNRIEGSVPQWFWNVGKDSLYYLNISHNLLTHIGKIPWENHLTIDLSSNRLQGPLPIPPPSIDKFSVSNNQFVGEVSSLFCNLTQIEVLDLSNNSLSGNIPPCFGNMSSVLTVLDLRMNKFLGMIPPAFVKGNSLRILNLNGNQLEGSLPRSLINCEGLEVLDVGNNKLNGSFPQWLESLTELQVLILRANNFHGPLSNPKARFPFQKLRIIDISHNEFSGVLPTKFFESLGAMAGAHTDVLEYMGEQTRDTSYYSVTLIIKGFGIELLKVQKLFITIDFSANNFTGEIPKVIGKLNSLKGLNFSHNNLSGLIPPSLGNLSNLEWLDLSSNKISGNIPFQLAAELNQLEILNLSSNKLEGPIPRGKQFDTFSNDSYGGNVGLCGPPLSKSCGDDEEQQHQGGDDDEDDKSGLIDWKVVMMGYGSGLVIGISVGYMVLFSGSFDYWLSKRFGGGRRRKTVGHSRGRRGSN